MTSSPIVWRCTPSAPESPNSRPRSISTWLRRDDTPWKSSSSVSARVELVEPHPRLQGEHELERVARVDGPIGRRARSGLAGDGVVARVDRERTRPPRWAPPPGRTPPLAFHRAHGRARVAVVLACSSSTSVQRHAARGRSGPRRARARPRAGAARRGRRAPAGARSSARARRAAARAARPRRRRARTGGASTFGTQRPTSRSRVDPARPARCGAELVHRAAQHGRVERDVDARQDPHGALAEPRSSAAIASAVPATAYWRPGALWLTISTASPRAAPRVGADGVDDREPVRRRAVRLARDVRLHRAPALRRRASARPRARARRARAAPRTRRRCGPAATGRRRSRPPPAARRAARRRARPAPAA